MTRRSIVSLFCCVFAAGALTVAAGASKPGASVNTDEEAEARKSALDVAGAFSNDGFKTRDGNWTGLINSKAPLLIQVHLYAGNQYWFTVGASRKAKKLAVTVFDETGAQMQSDNYDDAGPSAEDEGPRAAAGFAPTVSGPYYVRIKETDGAPASFSFIYSYK